MALCNSGAMSMGGSTIGRSINCELGCSGTAQISLNDAEVRDLAGVSSGAISLNDFYGASAVASVFDGVAFGTEVIEGGYYMGTISAASSSYYLIMAPNATGCACCQYRTDNNASGVGDERFDGYGNTYDHMTSSLHPAGNWTATRTINGFSDWYLPALCELSQLYTNQGCSPAGEGFCCTGSVNASKYWSSTERFSGACNIPFFTGNIEDDSKTFFGKVRAIRRVCYA